MIDCSAYLDAKLAHTSQAMMLCAAALLNAAMIRMPLLAERKLGWLARPPRPSKVLLFFSLAPAIRVDASCSRLYESHGCNNFAPRIIWQRQPSTVGRSELLSHEVYYSLKLCIGEFATHNSSAAIDSTQNEPIANLAAKLESVPSKW